MAYDVYKSKGISMKRLFFFLISSGLLYNISLFATTRDTALKLVLGSRASSPTSLLRSISPRSTSPRTNFFSNLASPRAISTNTTAVPKPVISPQPVTARKKQATQVLEPHQFEQSGFIVVDHGRLSGALSATLASIPEAQPAAPKEIEVIDFPIVSTIAAQDAAVAQERIVPGRRRVVSDTQADTLKKLEEVETKREQRAPQIVSLPELGQHRAAAQAVEFSGNQHAAGLQKLRERYERNAQERYKVVCFASNHMYRFWSDSVPKEGVCLTDDPLLYAVLAALKKRHETICTVRPEAILGAYGESKDKCMAGLYAQQRNALELMQYGTSRIASGRLSIKPSEPQNLSSFARGTNYELLGEKFLAQEENKHLLLFVKNMYAHKAKSSDGRTLLHNFLGFKLGQILVQDFYERYQHYGNLQRQVRDVVIPTNEMSDALSDGLRACDEIKMLIAVAMKSLADLQKQ